MKVEQIYTGCLAQGAYYIISNGEAAIVDPLREIQPYLDRAKKDKVTIKYIFETHFHADFVSGHLDLAKATGATIIYGPKADPTFKALIAKDKEEFKLGTGVVKVIHTPGHTLESTCYLLLDEMGKEQALFTGDTLFIGDVGRPDLAQKNTGITENELAETLFDSLRNRVMVLPDDVLVYPAHGAGSACGKNISKERFSTIGEQKKTNYALRADMTKEQFVKEVTDGLLPPPSYFPLNVKMNREGSENIDTVVNRGVHPLTPEVFEHMVKETGALILDTRDAQVFAKAFIPHSINIGIDGNFAPWVGSLVTDIMQPLLLVCEEGREEEVVIRLARVGYDHAVGYLQGGIASWINVGKEVESIVSISADDFAAGYAKDLLVVDVRKENEFQAEHVEGALHIPLASLNEYIEDIPKNKPVYMHCGGGYRSMIANSILKARGWDNVIDIAGGYVAMSKTNIPKTNFVCPSTLK